MTIKNNKPNARGELQLSVWFPANVIEKINKQFEESNDAAEKNGDLKKSFKDYFFENFIKPNLKN